MHNNNNKYFCRHYKFNNPNNYKIYIRWRYIKVTEEWLQQVLIEYKSNPLALKQTLKYIFADPENIELFSIYFFPHIITNEIPDFHSEMYDELLKDDDSYIAAPRGFAKSTITGIVYLIFKVVNNLDEFMVYISQNYIKTTQFLAPVRNEFKHNERLRFVYGDLTPSNNKDEEGKDREDIFDVNGIRIQAASFETNIRGFRYLTKRPTTIFLDDIESDERVRNPELRNKDEDKLNKIIIPSLDVNGHIKMIGTILHIESLLYKKIKKFNGKIYDAEVGLKPDTLLWESRFPREKLDKIKYKIGSLSYQQEYRNNPSINDISLIKYEWIKSCFRDDIGEDDLANYKFDKIVMGVDFAFSDAVLANKSEFITVGIKDGFYYILNIDTKKGMSIDEQMKHIQFNLFPKYKHNEIALEENSIRGITKDIKQYNLPIKLFWTGAADTPVKKTEYKNYEFPSKRHTVGKINLISRLSVDFENKRIIIPYKTEKDKTKAHELMEECLSFALSNGSLIETGVHPDKPIALGYALELSRLKQVIIDFG